MSKTTAKPAPAPKTAASAPAKSAATKAAVAKAEADLKKALELVPASQPGARAQVLNYLAYSWVDQNMNIDEAFTMLKQAVDAAPRDGMIIDSLGWAYFRLGRWDDAVRELEPVTCSYRGFEIASSPPPSSGGVIICEILNVLEAYPLSYLGAGSAETTRLMVEAMRHAFVDRNASLGDPDFVDNPVEKLLSKAYA